ncbi:MULTISPECIES: hypothetical protein [Nostoc]|uniref:Glycosyltransferase RgtA/B/C/D-like domain-containing protein n=1 Tax=Nostoc paludosum FACHB-159 TaxID=2692908 RepID=A0ABR8KEV6_9NOSO|nr:MULTISPECIES: hypothetical protein [Nostoc]MBD2682229.1 hypothetical protein [Nostoc sp. FACHB-857]MBD2736602.1 hypothetical protein [Nostoc paludosum FACHB-159]
MKQHNKAVLGLLVLLVLASVTYLFTVYTDTFGERDSYRMLLGMIDSIAFDKPLGARKIYGSNISFAYYALLDFFRPIFKADLTHIVPIMNYVNAAFAILMVIPFFFFVRRYWGTLIALLANILLLILPVWRVTGQYPHPMTGSMVFMFIGLALIGYRSFLNSLSLGWKKLILWDVLIVTAFALCLMFRLDAILMFPMIPACLLLERYPLKKIVYPSILYSILPVIIFKVMQAQLAYIKDKEGDGIFEQLLLWNNPARYVDQFVRGSLLFIWGLNPLLCLIFLISCVYLFYKRRYSYILFILPTVIINYIFWLPNPAPARHFIYLSPVVAISIAILVADIFPKVRTLLKNNTKIEVALAAFLIFSLVISNKYSYSAPLSKPYSYGLMRLGTELQQLEPKGKPIFVIGDTLPIAAQMQLISKETKVSPEETNILTDESVRAQEKSAIKPKLQYVNVLNVENQKNKFTFYIQGFPTKIKEIDRFLSETDKYDGYYLVVNMLDKNGKKIDFDPSSFSKKLDILKL